MDLKKECNGLNLGGLIDVEYIPIGDVEYIPDFIGPDETLNTPVVLKPSKVWFSAKVYNDSFGFSENPSENKQGEYYTKSLKGFFPSDNPSVRKIMSDMTKNRFILKYRDNNDEIKLLGSLEYPYSFRNKLSTNRKLKDSLGHDMEFYSSSPFKDRFIKI